MAGLEVVVRPVVFPDIRPRARPSLPPQDDPTKGFAVIKGNPASSVGLSDSWNVSSSKTVLIETERRVDEARIYQMQEDGAINEKNFIDVEVANRIKMRRALSRAEAAKAQAGEQQHEYDKWFFKHIQEEKNIRIKKRDEIIKNEEQAARDAGYDPITP